MHLPPSKPALYNNWFGGLLSRTLPAMGSATSATGPTRALYAMSLGQSACLRWVFMAAASEVPLLPLRVPLRALYAMTLSPAARLRWGLRLMKPCRLHPPPLSVERRNGP